MTKPHTHLRSAGSAIAVALALASTQVLAQEVQTTPEPAPQVNAQPAPTVPTDPVLITPVLPPSTPTTTTAPPVTQPSATPSTTTTATPEMRSNPVVQAVPEPAPLEESAEVAPAEPVAAPRPAASAPASAPAPAASNEPVTTADADLAEAETAPLDEAAAPTSEIAEPIASGEPAIAPVDASDSSNGLTWLFGALAAIGLALLALLFFRRRGNPDKTERIKPYKPAPAAKKPVAPAPAVATPVVDKAPAADDGFVNTQVVTTMDRQPANAAVRDAGLATAGASVPLPRKKPETVEERAALIDRLAAAKPDRANPFTAPKARRRRARLIVQSLDREFRNGSRIDLSQYPANWPHLARKTDTVVA